MRNREKSRLAARAKTRKRLITTTGAAAEYLPPSGQARDEILGLVRLALPFAAQHRGKRPGALAQLVLETARRCGSPYSFWQLIDALEDAAATYGADGKGVVDGVNRVRETVGICLPGREYRDVPFGTLRRHLTAAKIILSEEIRTSPKPRMR